MEDDKEPEWARGLPPESALPFQIFAENTELLYVCIWFQRDQILALFHNRGQMAARPGAWALAAKPVRGLPRKTIP